MKTTEKTVIGFDLGHGETALALADVDATDAPKVLDLPGATRRQHVTAVARTRSGEVVIGEEAIRRDDVARLWVAFKSRNLDDPDVGTPMSLLVQHVVADLVQTGVIRDSGAAAWVFGAPSGWEPQHYRKYEKLLVDAGLGGAKVIPESRAALLYARDSGEVDVRGDRIAQGVLIVDIGSSTTDYTYVTDLREHPCDHGNIALGASLIDKEIMRRAVARLPEAAALERALAQDPHSRRRLELGCRESKEKFFRTRREEIEASGARVGALHPVDTTTGASFVVDLRLSVAEMDAVLAAPQDELGGRSWSAAFAEDVASAIRQSGSVDLLLLTGGPSRMPFVVDTCRRLLGAERVALGNEPEVAIARGLALAGRTSVRAEGFRRDIQGLKKKIKPLVADRVQSLAQSMGDAVANGMTERHVIPAFAAWRNMHIGTLGEMVDRVVRGVKSDLEAGNNARIAEVTGQWQNELRAEIDTLTRPVANRWHVEPGVLKLKPVTVTTGKAVDVRVDTGVVTDNFDAAANAINVVVASIVGMTLFGAGTALIATTGPIGVIIAIGLGIAALNMGKEELMAKIQTYRIPGRMRKVQSESGMARKLRDKAAANEAELAENMAAEFEQEFTKSLVAQVATEIGAQLDARADEAELLIK